MRTTQVPGGVTRASDELGPRFDDGKTSGLLGGGCGAAEELHRRRCCDVTVPLG